MPKVVTDKKCSCGNTLEMEISNKKRESGVGWGSFSRHGGKDQFAMRCVCGGCGTVFDPDHPRFASYYNMAADSSCLKV